MGGTVAWPNTTDVPPRTELEDDEAEVAKASRARRCVARAPKAREPVRQPGDPVATERLTVTGDSGRTWCTVTPCFGVVTSRHDLSAVGAYRTIAAQTPAARVAFAATYRRHPRSVRRLNSAALVRCDRQRRGEPPRSVRATRHRRNPIGPTHGVSWSM